MSVAVSKLMYAAPVWAEGATATSKNRGAMEKVNRLAALRQIRAYRTVSAEAATFLAGSPPQDLLALERARLWELRREGVVGEELELRTR